LIQTRPKKRNNIAVIFIAKIRSMSVWSFIKTVRLGCSQGRRSEMPKRKNPTTEPFRRSQVVSPVPSGRRFGKAKFEKKSFDIYVSDIETGDETLAMTVFAPTQREAIQLAKKRLQSSPVLRKITYAAFTAVEIEH
jgi:hypothetical protein